ncbi:MAG: MipA/OmpV family protein [Geminicoccaceae bacterium]
MRTSTLVIAVVVIGAWLSTDLALAQPASTGDAIDPVDTAPGEGVRVTVGAGAGVAPDYEGSDYYEPVPLWNLSVGNLYHPKTYVQLFGPRLRSNLIPDDHWRLGVAGQFIRKRDNVHNDRVDDLESVDASLMLGLVGGYDFLPEPQQDLVLEVEARQDVANDNGFLATIRGAYGGRVTASWRAAGYVGATWADDDYMSSYFSVDAANAAASGLDQFNADEGFKDVNFGGTLTYGFLESWSVAVIGTYARLLGDAKDSPIVDDVGDANQFFGGALINYQF